MTTKVQPLLTIADWDAMPAEDGNRYEIIEGELFVSRSPGLTHQIVSDNLIVLIKNYLKTNPIGIAVTTPGVVLSDYSGVIPDLVFFRHEQRADIVTDDRLTAAPRLMVEILSPGSANIRRDRIAKFSLYAKHGVPEYWIVDPKKYELDRFVLRGSSFERSETLRIDDHLTSAELPGFSCKLREVFSEF